MSFVHVRRLGQGAMGEVSLVLRQEGRFERAYALKRLRASLLEDAAARAAFLDEARVAGFIRHPNVVRVYDLGEDDQGPYLLMDYVDGLSLGELIQWVHERGDVLPLSVVLELGRDVARGLEAAHDARDHLGAPVELLHRDISPDNILVGFDGAARVTDFGIAKALGRSSATTQNLLKGKLGYMAPEVLRFEEPSRASDLWSFGVVLFEALTQARLYVGEDAVERIQQEPAPDLLEHVPEAPDVLVRLLFTLLSKAPEGRPRDFAPVVDAMEVALARCGDGTLAFDYL
ncbi:MAG: serine/threonine-protein kinase, partial [Myxococcota bacterium]